MTCGAVATTCLGVCCGSPCGARTDLNNIDNRLVSLLLNALVENELDHLTSYDLQRKTNVPQLDSVVFSFFTASGSRISLV